MNNDADILPDDWQDADFSGCFWHGVQLAKEAVAAGEPLPTWLRSRREDAKVAAE